MPRALIAHPSPDVYGSDRQLVESVAGLVDAGWDVTVVLPAPGPLTGLLGDVRVEICDFPVLRKSLVRPMALARLALRFPRDLIRLIRLVRKANPDVVYVNTVTIPIWVLAARLARRPALVHVHEAEEMSSGMVRKLLYAPLYGAHAVIANSRTTRRVILQSLPGLDERVSVVLNGVPDPGPQPRNAVERSRIALVSRLSPRKGIDIALEAVARLRSAGRSVTLEICGTPYAGYEWFEASLRDRAARPDLAGAVIFSGYVAPISKALGRAEVLIAPSYGESFGNVAVEAMLAGRPVVASNVQGLAEIIDDSGAGLLVTAGDVDGFVAAVGRLLDDTDLAAQFAEVGRAAAMRLFGLARYRHEISVLTGSLVPVTRNA